jgi:hypothetical protein
MLRISEGKDEEFRRFQLWLSATEAMYGAIGRTEARAPSRRPAWPYVYAGPAPAEGAPRRAPRPVIGQAVGAVGRAFQRAADRLEAWGAPPPEAEECACQ